MKVLFICSANKDRSATAELLAREIWQSHEYDSAGTNQKLCFQLGTQYIQLNQIEWADIVFVMENKHKKEVIKLFGSAYGKSIKVIGIKDHYEFGNGKLKLILKEELQAYL
jgi:predicted protein tyrosine phosphatase